jgi:uncharacterized metal-binding protein YceD (DUF177 family)
MRILVTTIPFSGMKIDAPISKEALNSRLQEGSHEDSVVFEEAPIADLTLTRTHGGVMIKGIISGRCRQGCATCGDVVPHQAMARIDWLLQTTSDQAAPDDEMDDPGVIFYEGEHVDLEDHLQEALILNLSPFWHPARDSSDRCCLCKRDCSARSWQATPGPSQSPDSSNGKSSFGSLLRGALSKGKR